MVGSGPGGLLYPYVVRGYRQSTSPAQEDSLKSQEFERLPTSIPGGWQTAIFE